MLVTAIAGTATIAVGLALAILGGYMAWQSERSVKRPGTKNLSNALTGLTKLADALAKHPVGVRLVFLGIVLVVIGGAMTGVAGLIG